MCVESNFANPSPSPKPSSEFLYCIEDKSAGISLEKKGKATPSNIATLQRDFQSAVQSACEETLTTNLVVDGRSCLMVLYPDSHLLFVMTLTQNSRTLTLTSLRCKFLVLLLLLHVTLTVLS